jgi:hypothetical protein
MDATRSARIRAQWAEVTALVDAAAWILQWADYTGPLAHLPTHDPAVAVMMAARRHLLRRAQDIRTAIFTKD